MEYLKIRDENGKIVPMKFSASQEKIWEQVAPRLDTHERLWFIVLKCRQMYASTFFMNLTFCRTIEQPGTHSLVLAQDLDTSQALFNKAKVFYEHLDMPKFQPAKKREIVFPFPKGQSVFTVVSAGVSAKGRGMTQSCVHASESAFWLHPEILTGLFQSMPDVKDTEWVLESTANGKQGDGRMFYEEWQRAISGESFLQPIFIPWYTMAKYRGSYIGRDPLPENEWDDEEKILNATFGIDGDQLAWRRYAIKTKTQGQIDLFHQEYPSTAEEAFISSGLPAFDRLALTALTRDKCQPAHRGYLTMTPGTKDIRFTHDPTGVVRIWQEPVPGHQYVIGADTAEGLEGGDYTCAEVLDMGTLEQVASIHGSIAPWDFALMLNAMGLWYNKAIVAIEVNNIGHAVQDHMIRTHLYPNLHPWKGKPDRVHRGKAKLWGWETNSYSRPLMIEAGRRVINHRLVTIHEDKLFDELFDFSRNDQGKYEAEAGHDDRVMAFLVALRSREENYAPAKRIEVMSEDMLPGNIRVVEIESHDALTRRRTARFLREKLNQGLNQKNWMEM